MGAPFKLRSGNSPLKQNIFRKKGGPTTGQAVKTGLNKFFGNITSTLGKDIKQKESDVRSLGKDIKKGQPLGKQKKIEKANITASQAANIPYADAGSKVKEGQGTVSSKKKVKPAATDYSKAKSVNALVAQRTKWKTNKANKGKKFPGQGEINKRLKLNPNKWD